MTPQQQKKTHQALVCPFAWCTAALCTGTARHVCMCALSHLFLHTPGRDDHIIPFPRCGTIGFGVSSDGGGRKRRFPCLRRPRPSSSYEVKKVLLRIKRVCFFFLFDFLYFLRRPRHSVRASRFGAKGASIIIIIIIVIGGKSTRNKLALEGWPLSPLHKKKKTKRPRTRTCRSFRVLIITEAFF